MCEGSFRALKKKLPPINLTPAPCVGQPSEVSRALIVAEQVSLLTFLGANQPTITS